MSKKILLLITLFIMTSPVNAKTCSKEELKQYQELADKVEVTYEQVEPYEGYKFYLESEDSTEMKIKTSMVVDEYRIKISNILEGLYVLHDKYKHKDVKDNLEITSRGGTNDIAIYSNNCDTPIKTIELYLPKYNYYSDYEECDNSNIKNVKECKKWIAKEDEEYFNNLSEDDFINKIEEYNNQNIFQKLVRILTGNIIYGIIFISIFLIMIITLILITRKKRGRLE